MDDLPVIELVEAMPGFPGDRRFALVRLDDDGILHGLRSLDRDDLEFVVVPPAPFYPRLRP
ncbi:flagellar assembly protein FliW [Nocardioides sp. TF02-7]|uniref:flagellar assembly protein FliW n=1 Tax=Nocardioides sp. TF02-7 TaxID=2917724 RepID=UPI001F067F42|nr:flagellar assembly protein FliW [Nocardioides sp. TF02-7]UMG92943.1 flagellar assembly protein FliW [Nocardioides sp. TF02-7]